jgi:hypothetical protein
VYAAILECLWVLAIGVQDSAEVDEPCASEYASASQFFPLLAGEEILGANQRDGVLEDLAGL